MTSAMINVGRIARLAAGALACAAALAGSSTATAQSPLASGGFRVGLEPRTFDGATFDVVRLDSPIVTISAYSFGAWSPAPAAANQAGLVLRHRAFPKVAFVAAPVEASRNLASPEQWIEYVNSVRQGFGTEVTLGAMADSSVDHKVVEILGWTTREATFVIPQPEGREAYVEQHVVVSGPEAGAVFVLGGSESQVDAVRRDFRFFLARLEPHPHASRMSANRRIASTVQP